MTYANTDIIAPKMLVVPISETLSGGTAVMMSGMLIMSGGHLLFWSGAAWDQCDA